MFGFVLIWLIFCGIVAAIANGNGRSGVGWFFISVIVSPLLGLIIVLALGKTIEKEAERAMAVESIVSGSNSTSDTTTNSIKIESDDEKNFKKVYDIALTKGASSDAYYDVAMLFLTGKGTEQAFGRAIKYFKMAAEMGHSKACHNIAVMYENGDGVDADAHEAELWYSEAKRLEPAKKTPPKKVVPKKKKLSSKYKT